MWSIFNKIGQLLGIQVSEPIVDINDIAAILDAEDPPLGEEQPTDGDANLQGCGVVCQHKGGVITALHETHGYIRPHDAEDNSNLLYFKRQDCPRNLEVGTNVVFLTYKISENSDWIVRKVLYVENECWDKNDKSDEVDLFLGQSAIK